MRILGPAKTRGDWLIQRLHHADGLVRFHTGEHICTEDWDPRVGARVPNGRLWNGMRVENTANAIIEAAFRLDGKNLVCAASGHLYLVSQSTLYDVVEALVDGRLRAVDGTVSGRWTFKRFYGKIWLAPAPRDKKAKATSYGDDAGAPDLSDLVAVLSKDSQAARR